MSKVVVITGGNSGIGEACARRFADGGYSVVVCGRRETENERVCESIRSGGGLALGIIADLRDENSVYSTFAKVLGKWKRLDCLVNSIGIDGASFTITEEYPTDAFDDVIATNVKAPWLCMKTALPIMRAAGKGSIVNVSSLAGLKASFTGGSAYTASKHAVVGMTKAAAREYGAYGIRVNAVCPGFVNTPLAQEVMGDTELRRQAELQVMRRICKSSEVAQTVYWLSSDESSFISGVSIPVDGGEST